MFNLDAPVLKDANGQHFQSWARCSRVRRLLAINPATLAVACALLGEGNCRHDAGSFRQRE
jgi:hypothetical protein